MECPKREGKKHCIWWLTGCLKPDVPPEIKLACSKTVNQLPRSK